MKTPWRFVSDLVSRKPADKQQDAPPPAVVDANLLDLVAVHGGKPEQTTSVESVPTDLPADRAAHEEIAAAPPVPEESISEAPEPEPAAAETDATDVEQEPLAALTVPEADTSIHDGETAPVIATAPEPEPEPEPETQKVPKRARASTPLAPRTPAGPAAAPPKSLLEEMTYLDLEIVTLRRQLSAKLAKQNAQMRELLDRYEAR